MIDNVVTPLTMTEWHKDLRSDQGQGKFAVLHLRT